MKQPIRKNHQHNDANSRICAYNYRVPENTNPLRNSSLNEANTVRAPVQCAGNIPAILNVPKGNKLASQLYATGVQIYQVQPSTANPATFKWVLVGPLATLYVNEDYTNPVGNHYAGPTWEFKKGFNKGEKIVAKKTQEASVDATAVPGCY
jgi:hypothetical protein